MVLRTDGGGAGLTTITVLRALTLKVHSVAVHSVAVLAKLPPTFIVPVGQRDMQASTCSHPPNSHDSAAVSIPLASCYNSSACGGRGGGGSPNAGQCLMRGRGRPVTGTAWLGRGQQPPAVVLCNSSAGKGGGSPMEAGMAAHNTTTWVNHVPCVCVGGGATYPNIHVHAHGRCTWSG
jgi:hypothetical protein